MLDPTQPRSLRACSRDDPECGARRGVLRRRLVTARLGRLGTPPSRHYDLGARSSLHGSARQLPAVVGRRASKETEARPREPKTATVERREASVPRHKHGTQGASQAPGVRRYRTPNGCRCTRTFLGAPLTPRFAFAKQSCKLRAKETRG